MTAIARLLLAMCVLAVSIPLLASEAEDAVNQLYGDDLKRVAATPAAADDIALAKQLLEAAAKAEKQAEFLTLLCEKAYELAAKDASGYATATAAMDLLGEKVPEKKVEGLLKVAALYQKHYAAARLDAKAKAGEAFIAALTKTADAQVAAQDIDGASATLKQAILVATTIKSDQKAALQAQLENLAPAQKMEKQIAALKARLEKDPADAASRKELVRLLLVEEDNAAEAGKFLDESLDEATRKYVPAATKPLDEAPELACKELGEWYRGLADQATAPMSKGAMLRRAQGYYERFLDLHKDEDLARTTASLMLKKIEDALAKLPAAKVAAGAWTDCLKLVDAGKHVGKTKWEMRDQVLIAYDARLSRVVIPVAPTGNYELEASFVRTAGDGAISLIIPVGTTSCEVALSLAGARGARGERYSGIAFINGKSGEENEAVVKPGVLANGQEYVVNVRVLLQGPQAEIQVRLDGKPYTQWKGPAAALSLWDGWRGSDPKCPGLTVNEASVEFRRVRIRALSGEIKTPEAPTKLTAEWTDCLKLVDPAKDAVKGKWVRKGEALATAADAESSRIAIPVTPAAGYEVQVSFVRLTGNDAVAVILPVGGSACNLTLSAGRGEAHGLEAIRGKWAGDNESSGRPGILANGHEYLLAVQVSPEGDGASISATLDGRPLLRWKGPQSALAIPSGWQMPNPRYLGLGAFQSAVEFRRVRIRALPDDARTPAERPTPKPRG